MEKGNGDVFAFNKMSKKKTEGRLKKYKKIPSLKARR